MNNKEFPWNQIKIAFSFDGLSSKLWDHLDTHGKDAGLLPNGWELIETESNPAFDTLAIFNVSVIPTIKDSKKIAQLLKNLEKTLK